MELRLDEEILKPTEVQHIPVLSLLICDQTSTGKYKTQTQPYITNTFGYYFACEFGDLNIWEQQHFDCLSFTASVFIPYIVFRDSVQGRLSRSISNLKSIWNIQSGVLGILKKMFRTDRYSRFNDNIVSPILDNMWQIQFKPNFRHSETGVEDQFSLKLVQDSPSIKSIKVRFTLSCVESGAVKTAEKRFQIGSSSHFNSCDLNLLRKSDLSNNESLTLVVGLEILQIKSNDDEDADEMPTHCTQQTSDPAEIAKIITALKRSDMRPLTLQEAQTWTLTNTLSNVQTTTEQTDSNTNDVKALQNVVEKQKATIESLQSKVDLLTAQLAKIQSMISDERKVEGVDDLKERVDALDLNVKRLMEQKEEKEHENAAVSEVQRWLKMVNLVEYLDLFIRNGFDQLSVIQTLSMDDLLEMGIEKKGHRIRIVQAIAIMKATGTTSQSQTAKPSEPGTPWSWNSELF